MTFLENRPKMPFYPPGSPQGPPKGQMFWNDKITSIFMSNLNILLIYTKNSELLVKNSQKRTFLENKPKMPFYPPGSPLKVPSKGQMFWNDNITSKFMSNFNILLIYTKNSEFLGKKQPKKDFFGKSAQNAILPPGSPPRSPKGSNVLKWQYLCHI